MATRAPAKCNPAQTTTYCSRLSYAQRNEDTIMTNKRFEKVYNTLEALNEYFQEHDGQTVLFSDGRIFDNDLTVKEAIAEALEAMQNPNKD